MVRQRRLDLPGEGFFQQHAHAFFANFQQAPEELVTRAVEHLQGIALGHAQHAAYVMRLSLRQFMLTEAQRRIDEETGQSHVFSLKNVRFRRERARI